MTSAEAVALARLWTRAALGALVERRRFAEVEAFCFFIGHARSGHSLVGALLDAHPDVVMGHEAHALKLVGRRVPRDLLYGLLLESSRAFRRGGCVGGGGYPYLVPGSTQGRYRRLRVIGDKRGGGSLVELGRDLARLDRLRAVVGVPLRVVHVTRNPWDNIATMAKRRGDGLEAARARFFRNCDAALRVRALLRPGELFDLSHERFVADPAAALSALAAFLGVEAEAPWVSAAAAIVRPRPHRSRDEIAWPAALRERIAAEAAGVPFLAGHAFEDAV